LAPCADRHQRRPQRTVGIHEIEELPEVRRIAQRRCADIAEHADVAALQLQAARHLHAAKQQQVVDLRHQADAFGVIDEVAGRDDVAFLGAQARQRLVVAHLALRQRDDWLQIKIDAVGVDRLADQFDDALAAHIAEAAAADRVAFAQRQRAVGIGRGNGRQHGRGRQGALLL
jgi:hypothetical protein